MSLFTLNDPVVSWNGNPIYVMPNSVKFDDGEGETTTRSVSSGGGKTQQIISQAVEDKVGKLMFDMPNDIKSIKMSRQMKRNPGTHVFELTGRTDDGETLYVPFTSAVVTNRVEKNLSSDGVIPMEVSSDPTFS